MTNDAQGIAEHLRQLAVSAESLDDESELLRNGAMPLLLQLGYSPDEIFFDYSIPWLDNLYHVDAAVAPTRHSSPWLLLEVKVRSEFRNFIRIPNVLSGLGSACGARGLMLLTPGTLSVASSSGYESHVRLSAITREWAKDFLAEVGRDTLASPGSAEKGPIFQISAQSASGKFFVDQLQLEQRLAAACEATDSRTKCTSFEGLASYILSGLSGVEIRKKNLRTETGELDLVCRWGAKPHFLQTADKYFLVECKNWKKPVSAKEIEAFHGKLSKCRSRLGLLFSRNGITGRTGQDAVGNVEALWRQYGTVILVITEENIRQVIQGYDFYSLLEQSYESVRFSERGGPHEYRGGT